MLCQRCQKAQATVHIDEVQVFRAPGAAENEVEQQHMCETCAQDADLPHIAVQQKTMDEVWKLLQMSAMKAQKKQARVTPTCATCGTSLEHLRRKGRVGCQDCYVTFESYLDGLLERMHGSTEHTGRMPGMNVEAAQRRRNMDDAREQLEVAVHAEDFERAAELRDELLRLEGESLESESLKTEVADAAQDEGTSTAT